MLLLITTLVYIHSFRFFGRSHSTSAPTTSIMDTPLSLDQAPTPCFVPLPDSEEVSPISPLTPAFPSLVNGQANISAIISLPATDGTPSPTSTPVQDNADFQSALDDIIHKADLQMKMLDSIHEAMQRELNEMFDRHESAKHAAQKLGDMMRHSKAKPT